ncbi:hypothetical protein EYR41_000812 [Orbilia oligospora]|uniref:LDB19 N-terminal domain-containing protein n=1 Tax=Orbilia oligospora TaxID=2813651 RepID=A0A7C8PJT5_ORBOL|nr:hypothetical protein TWF751_011243 [Orbilia oligospora]TGJ73737.1 hypothetical protein EYR41_000812 [Orbilia oligospora]
MPSLIRSFPVPHYVPYSHNGMPGTIVDLDSTNTKPRSTRSSRSSNRDSADYSIRSYKSSKSSKSSQESITPLAGSLHVQIESPPIVCYGPASESSGALLSGMLWLTVAPWEIDLESLKLTFQSTVTTKKPVVFGCPDCTSKTTDLNTWDFITSTHPVSHGLHSYPFSYLVPGNLPATTDSQLGSIKYHLSARGITNHGEVLQFAQEIKVARSILEGNDRNSLRIFPPTNLSATLTLPSVIHRGGNFPVEMRLEGVVTRTNFTRWKLRKATWRIEEKSKIISPACKVHAHKIGGEGKGVKYEDIKVLATEEYKTGWKSDFDTSDGKVEFGFTAGIPAYITSTDDVDNTTGLTVSHNLVVELIVAEEYCPKNSKLVTPTGSARVLRMQFNMNTTARAGMGISWEDECPPRYDDVPQSPPTYQTLVCESQSVEDLHSI